MQRLSKEHCYYVLGLKPGASRAEIQRAFRKRVRECHPDLQQDDEGAEAELKQVVAAYRALMENKAKSRSEILNEAFRNPVESSPQQMTMLPTYQLGWPQLMLLIAGVVVAAYIFFWVLNAFLNWESGMFGNGPFRYSPAWLTSVSLFFASQMAGAGGSAAFGSAVGSKGGKRRAMISGAVLGAFLSITGTLSPLYEEPFVNGGFDHLAIAVVAAIAISSAGALLGWWLSDTLSLYGYGLVYSGGEDLKTARIFSAVAACVQVMAFWVVLAGAVGLLFLALGLILAVYLLFTFLARS